MNILIANANQVIREALDDDCRFGGLRRRNVLRDEHGLLCLDEDRAIRLRGAGPLDQEGLLETKRRARTCFLP